MANTEFSIETADGVLSFSSTTACNITMKIVHNNKTSDTQGNLIKLQQGFRRCEMVCEIMSTKTDLDDNLLPMLTYPQNVLVTIDRNILGRTSNSGEFALVDYDLGQEFDEGESQEIKIKLIEVLAS